VRAWLQRLLLLAGLSYGNPADTDQRALFGVLREIRTGSLRPAAHVRAGLTALAQASQNWLVRTEVSASPVLQDPWPGDIRGRKEAFRRLRDTHAIQVALDLPDLQQAIAVAKAAVAAGARFIEIGDPLIKSVGVVAIEHVKRAVPQTAVVAEMMSSDWGHDQVILAAESGADVVLLIGPASTASVAAAVEASQRLAIPVVLDAPAGRLDQTWVHSMERTGIDGFAITTNIDLGVAGPHPLDQARTLRSWTRLPVAVSGGFGTADEVIATHHDWDILVVGRSVAEAVDPTAAAQRLINHITAHPPRTGK